jgi:hypothetical protein
MNTYISGRSLYYLRRILQMIIVKCLNHMNKKAFKTFVVYVDHNVVKSTLDQATNTQRGSRGIAVLRL